MIDGRNFYDQPIDDLIKQYDKVRKISIGQGDDYTTECLLDYAYFKELSEFQGIAGQKLRLYTVLEKSKETLLEFYKEKAKDL